jgi:hypothetical protein
MYLSSLKCNIHVYFPNTSPSESSESSPPLSSSSSDIQGHVWTLQLSPYGVLLFFSIIHTLLHPHHPLPLRTHIPARQVLKLRAKWTQGCGGWLCKWCSCVPLMKANSIGSSPGSGASSPMIFQSLLQACSCLKASLYLSKGFCELSVTWYVFHCNQSRGIAGMILLSLMKPNFDKSKITNVALCQIKVHSPQSQAIHKLMPFILHFSKRQLLVNVNWYYHYPPFEK